MARSTIKDIFNDVRDYSHAILAFVDKDGFPVSVATDFEVVGDRQVITLKTPSLPQVPSEGTEVNVVFSHVRPYPGVGYDQRRYVCAWGSVSRSNGTLEFTPRRAHGWDEDRMHFFELCERSVPVAHAYMAKLSAERGQEVKPTMTLGWLIFLASRLPFLTATIVPVLLGALVARADGFSSWWRMLLALVGGSAIHLGLNIANDVSDATSGADEANVNPTMFSGGSRVIQYGLVSKKAMQTASIALYAVGIAIGLFFVAITGPELLWIGAAGIFLSIFYTAPPFKLVHRGLGELCVALGFGPIMVLGSYFVIAERLTFEAFYASLPVAILIMLVLYVNQIPDKPADARAGKKTVVVRLPKEAIVLGYGLFVALTYGLIVAGAVSGLMPLWSLIALATVPLALKVYRALGSHYESPYELMGAMGTNVMLHFATGMLMVLGYALHVIF